ncbi:glycogen synthase [Candidatus Thiodictyon syntrophicum]|jgi:starch synthase|uniref:Glycogen synthase n=1 Tax=Candidatus Thiodictyon syntrophicum TaxID=1166950 RepID=A0A2K8U7K7_9GAMM|nr:glycogen synthase [Candidatus Thiodictyon syntrophicum]AUB81535.1 glycogen synthase [Candidatus Thiodictyon syntrophicum]
MAKSPTKSKKTATPAPSQISPQGGPTTDAAVAAAAPPPATKAAASPGGPLPDSAPGTPPAADASAAGAAQPAAAAPVGAAPAAIDAPVAATRVVLPADQPAPQDAPARPAPAAPATPTAAPAPTPTAAVSDAAVARALDPEPASATLPEPANPPAAAAPTPTAAPDAAVDRARDPEPEPETAAQPAAAAPPAPEEHPDSGYHPAPESAHAPAPAPQHHRQSLFIVHITPEMAPVAKVGGLADVVFGISREQAIRGNHVEIILPKYANLRYDHIFELHEVYRDLWVPWHAGAVHCTVFFGFVHGRKCFFIEPHSQDNFFNRGTIYGFRDDVLRFAFFSRAAIEFLWKAGKNPDIIHCHDWQTALVPVFLYEFYQQLGMTHPRACLTIHNFMHQGLTGLELLRATGLTPPERFFDWLRMGDNHHKGALNLLKAGIVYSNFVTTVSPRYAFETKDQGQGFGLEPTLHVHHMKYGGILNGIDYDVWNPEVDADIPVRYSVDHLDGKYENKRALRHRLMLADNDKPIVAFIGRLDPQKGLGLVRHAIFYTLERGGQFVLLGSSPDKAINDDFWGLKRMLNDSPDCHLEIGFDEDLAHLIYAGADLMLVPSEFEPCGLTQLIALRYGTVPVVRTVGGLADTVFDKDHSDRPLDQRNGYRFDHYDGPGLESALGRAIDCYFEFPADFRELMKNGMRADYSWNQPGQDYLNIYDFIRER